MRDYIRILPLHIEFEDDIRDTLASKSGFLMLILMRKLLLSAPVAPKEIMRALQSTPGCPFSAFLSVTFISCSRPSTALALCRSDFTF